MARPKKQSITTKDTQKVSDQSKIETSTQNVDAFKKLNEATTEELAATFKPSPDEHYISPVEDLDDIALNLPVEPLQQESTETNTVAAPTAKPPVIDSEDASELTKISIRSDGVVWNSKDAFTTWVNKILLAARAGLTLDLGTRIRTESVPFFLSMNGTPEQITRYEELLIENMDAKVVEGKKVNVNYLNRYDFVKRLIAEGVKGAVIAKGTVSTRSPRFNSVLIVEEK